MQEIADAKRKKQEAGAVLTMKDVAEIIDRIDRGRLNLSRPDSVALTAPERIYSTYPRKVGKTSAIKAIARVLMTVPVADLLAKTQAYADAVAKWPPSERQFIPHPSTWFNRGSYMDDPKEWQRGKPEKPSEPTNYSQI